MDSLKILTLSCIQGITELLPVSSSAHIILFGEVLNIQANTALLTMLHFGSTMAIMFFLKDIIFDNLLSKNNRVFLVKVLIATIPAAIVGVLFEDYIENILRGVLPISISLVLWGIVMIILDRSKRIRNKDIKNIPFWKIFLIGSSQIFALIPGTSRSGITSITGILLGIEKFTAFKLGLLMGIPILLGSSFWIFVKSLVNNNAYTIGYLHNPINVAIIILIPFITSLLSLRILKKFSKKNWLTFFGIYRIALGVFLLLLQYGS